MNKNKYKILSKFPKKDVSTKNIIDNLFSIFSFELLYIYLQTYISDEIYMYKTKNYKKIEIAEIDYINMNILYIEYKHWSLKESNKKYNKNNLYLQKKIYDIDNLYSTIENCIKSYFKIHKIKNEEEKIKKIKNKIIKRINLKKIIPLLEKKHEPMFMSLDNHKEYNIKKKIEKNVNNIEYVFYIYKVNDVITKFPFYYKNFSVILKRKPFDVKILSPIAFRYNITNDNLKILKKRYKKDKGFNNAVFYLLSTYARLDETLYNVIYYDIDSDKIKKLYNKSIELVGNSIETPIDRQYFGIYPDIEQHFGSLGSFYQFEPINGVYSIDLKLSDGFIKNTMEKINKWLKSNKKITFIIRAPVIFKKKYMSLEDDIYNQINKINKNKYLQDISIPDKRIFILSNHKIK